MKKIIAIAAALAINAGILFAIQDSADDALPKGEVIVTELGIEPVATLAGAPRDGSLAP